MCKTSGNPHGKLFLIRVIYIYVVVSFTEYPLLCPSWNRKDEAEHVVKGEDIAPLVQLLVLVSFLPRTVLTTQEAANKPFCFRVCCLLCQSTA